MRPSPTQAFDEAVSRRRMVEFQPLSPTEHADAYFGLLMVLEDLFQRPIDLVEEGASCNPFFLQTVEQSSALLYVA